MKNLFYIFVVTVCSLNSTAAIHELIIPSVSPGVIDEKNLTTGDVKSSILDNESYLPVIYSFGKVFIKNNSYYIVRERTDDRSLSFQIRVSNQSDMSKGLVGKNIIYSGKYVDLWGETPSVEIESLKVISKRTSIPLFWCSGSIMFGPEEGFSPLRSHSMFYLNEVIYDPSLDQAVGRSTYMQFSHGEGISGIDKYSPRYLQFSKTGVGGGTIDVDGSLASIAPAPEGVQITRVSGGWSFIANEYESSRSKLGIQCIAVAGRRPW